MTGTTAVLKEDNGRVGRLQEGEVDGKSAVG